MRLAAKLLCVAFLAPSVTEAQVVRGAATERSSGQPLAGVLVSLEGADGSGTAYGNVLTSKRGEYRILAPAPGRYRITAKRIGVQRFVSQAFDLGGGETRNVDIVLDAVVYRLPTVTVESEPLCVLSERARGRVLALWDEVRTALTATQISLRDRLFRGNLTRYVRELDPRNLRVLSETRSQTQGIMHRPFVAVHPETLSARGYWQRLDDGSLLF
ncbi:MAG TPA: carboxypeptidase-like regulatory domain-containing protein, partial [Gemmatimonadaceae bacterium]|nr:carboxypeptidase-like regulatory domain-containing protein [Gemmatimonadaceae bacterium]